eukprot:CAMPEP_0177354344 /NCGR_PEP_ID=MMETSP0368-20130122/33372_1 /TAXON_ID=447022 ORGANISM="Scrippsiella hangoei-like, Strain SHHI-4" /NCGR_SAMPLE_ID=MMETSP0368 /ASSEMBLY_ACC=CAM_ASM_000363 /LENGTH=49 /DNA_ID= /DNA_START= /DNA_END= /DNA_ORIENTATION=
MTLPLERPVLKTGLGLGEHILGDVATTATQTEPPVLSVPPPVPPVSGIP